MYAIRSYYAWRDPELARYRGRDHGSGSVAHVLGAGAGHQPFFRFQPEIDLDVDLGEVEPPSGRHPDPAAESALVPAAARPVLPDRQGLSPGVEGEPRNNFV